MPNDRYFNSWLKLQKHSSDNVSDYNDMEQPVKKIKKKAVENKNIRVEGVFNLDIKETSKEEVEK